MATSSSKVFWDKHATASTQDSGDVLNEAGDVKTHTVHAVSPAELMHCHVSIQEIRRLIAVIGIGASHQDMINMHLCNIENSLPINLPGSFDIKGSLITDEPI
jgi:hypothetical protein